ncbi:MAG TPA: hypothetical protein PKD61_11930, partial [Polyangiaceae bacterium]|nr:hypothetical protein [Polyangiaceae bacterium]
CDRQKFAAKLEKKPVDVVFILDNSCSMTDEILAIQNNINQNFAQIIAASGVDYRVVFIAEQGPANPDESICIGPPLGGTSCPVSANQTPVNNPPIFYHYDNNDVESHDSWCKMMDWYDKPDRYNLAATGWREWLRTEAFKAFVEITDDGISCSRGQWSYNDSDQVGPGTSAAQQFDQDLLARDPAQFGTAADRNYVWYSIIGIGPNPGSSDKSWAPTDPVNTSKCSTAPGPGTGYQALSNLTGGIKFPVCEGQGFDVVFQEIAKGVIKSATIACEFNVPAPPQGQELDLKSLTVEFTPQAGSPVKFGQVDNLAACTPNSFYIETDKIKLCPDSCTTVQGAENAELQILALCKGPGPF